MALGAILKVKMDSSAVKRGLMNLKRGFARVGAVAKASGRMAAKFWKPIGVTLAVVAAGAMRSVNFMTEINNEMKRTGRSVPDILATGKALELVGLNADESADLINDMQERLQDARYGGGTGLEGIEALKGAGLVLQDLLQMGPQDQFEKIMRAANKAGLDTAETAFALDKIFGGQGMRLTGLAFDYEKIMGEARSMTKDLSEQIEKLGPEGIEKVQFAFERMKTSIKAVGVSFAQMIPWEAVTKLAQSVAGSMTKVIGLFNSMMDNPRGFFIASLEVFLMEWAKFTKGVSNWIDGLLERIANKATEIGANIGKAITEGLGGLGDLINKFAPQLANPKTATPFNPKSEKWKRNNAGFGLMSMGADPGIGKKILGGILDSNRLLGNIESKPGASFVG